MNINDQKLYLKNILESNTFKKSPSSVRLLKFLANATFDKNDLKETTIGLELFGDSFLNETNSSRIRVSIYNLRKRLDSYYENEGKEDSYRIEIKKGQYYVSFKRNNNHKTIDYNKRYKLVLSLIIVLLICFGITITKILYQPKIVLWNSFFKSEKETILVVGDLFGVEGRNYLGRTSWYRDYNINSNADLFEFKRKNPFFKDSIYASSYTYITGMGSVASKDITKLFTNHQRDISIKLSSKLEYRDLKQQNIIYVGPLKNKNKMIDYFNQTNTEYNLFSGEKGISLKHKKKGTIYPLSTATDNTEYAIVSKFYEKSNGNSQFMFFSDHDIGVMATVEYFTTAQKIKAFTSKYKLGEKTSFTALFKVKGQERTNLSLELIIVAIN